MLSRRHFSWHQSWLFIFHCGGSYVHGMWGSVDYLARVRDRLSPYKISQRYLRKFWSQPNYQDPSYIHSLQLTTVQGCDRIVSERDDQLDKVGLGCAAGSGNVPKCRSMNRSWSSRGLIPRIVYKTPGSTSPRSYVIRSCDYTKFWDFHWRMWLCHYPRPHSYLLNLVSAFTEPVIMHCLSCPLSVTRSSLCSF